MSGGREGANPRLGRSSGVILAARLIGNAGYFVAVLILARMLGPDGRGALAFLTVATLVVTEIASFGVAAATTVFVPQRPALRAKLLTNLVAFGLVSSLLCGTVLFGSVVVLGIAPASATDTVLAMCLIAVVLSSLVEQSLYFLIATGRATSYAIVVATAPWLYAGLLLVAEMRTRLDVRMALTMWLVSLAVAATGASAAAVHKVGLARPDIGLLAEALRFGFKAWVGNLANFLNFRLDQILMAFLVAEAVLGTYAVAVNFSEILFFLPTIVGMLIVPYVAGVNASDREDAVAYLLRMTLIVTAAFAILGSVVGPLAIPLVFGEAFRGSITPFLILLPAALGYAAMRIVSGALVGSSRPGRSSIGPVVALGIGVTLDLALIPLAGATGAAIAASVALLAGGFASLVAYRGIARLSARDLLPKSQDAHRLRRSLRKMDHQDSEGTA